METLEFAPAIQQVLNAGQVQYTQDKFIMRFDSEDRDHLEKLRQTLKVSFNNNSSKFYYLSDIWEMANGSFRFMAAKTKYR